MDSVRVLEPALVRVLELETELRVQVQVRVRVLEDSELGWAESSQE